MKAAVVPKKLMLPFTLITSLFVFWGFANAVTDPMVTAFKKVLELSNLQASLVQMAFYGGYFTMALPAAYFIRKYSYKTGVVIGLLLFAMGAFLFYPAASIESFGFFLAGLYVLTFGLAFLETTANPFILSLGSSETATQRLNLAQAFNPLGLLSGILVAQQFVFKKLGSVHLDFEELSQSQKAMVRTSDLLVIRNPYVGLGILVLLLLLLVLFTKMPKNRDSNIDNDMKTIIASILKKPRYAKGVMTQMFYVGAQIMCWTYIYQYAEAIGVSNEVAGNYQFAAFIVFFLGRLICTLLLRVYDSGTLLMIFSIAAVICIMATVFNTNIYGLYSLVGVSFFMSLMFPTIYGIALQGLTEDESKVGAAGLVMAIVGGALMPALQGWVLDLGGPGYSDVDFLGIKEINFSFALPLICFLLIARYGKDTRQGEHTLKSRYRLNKDDQ